MTKFLFFVIVALAIAQSLADDLDDLECYQCSPVTNECKADTAPTIKCPGKGQCLAQWKKESDMKMAIRKCVIPDSFKCPPGSECKICNEKLCNSATALRFAPLAWVGVICAVLYLN